MATTSLKDFFVPNMKTVDFVNPGVIVFIFLGIAFIILGLLFSSLQSGGKLDGIVNYLRAGMQPADMNKLDNQSREIVEHFQQIINNSQKIIQETQVQLQQVQNQAKDAMEQLEEVKSHAQEQQQPEPAVAPAFESAPAATNDTFTPSLDDDDGFGPSDFSDFDDDDDDEKGAATVIASVPEELLAQAQAHVAQFKADPDTGYKQVFQDYFSMKEQCGESTAGLTEAAFVTKLKTTEAGLKQKHNCQRVEFSVQEKGGKASLKATPKF